MSPEDKMEIEEALERSRRLVRDHHIAAPEEDLSCLEKALKKEPSTEVAKKACLLSRLVVFHSLGVSKNSDYFKRAKILVRETQVLVNSVVGDTNQEDPVYEKVLHYQSNVAERLRSMEIVEESPNSIERSKKLQEHLFPGSRLRELLMAS